MWFLETSAETVSHAQGFLFTISPYIIIGVSNSEAVYKKWSMYNLCVKFCKKNFGVRTYGECSLIYWVNEIIFR